MWAGSSSWVFALPPLVADVVVADALDVLELPIILRPKLRSLEENFSFSQRRVMTIGQGGRRNQDTETGCDMLRGDTSSLTLLCPPLSISQTEEIHPTGYIHLDPSN